MSKKIISLSTKEELEIFMSPQRQKLIREMSLSGKPLTPKILAGKLQISASAATHHIKKLMELGIIELDHTEIINGIVAHFYRLTDSTVSIGLHADDGLSSERDAIVQNMILNTLRSFNSRVEYVKQNGVPQERLKDYGDFLSGVLHLKPEDVKKLMELIRNFVDTHEASSADTRPWEYALIIFDSGAGL